MEDIFDSLYPEYKGELAKVIVSEDPRVYGKGGLLKQFVQNDMPRVALSVDMLDTGIDIRELTNLVFAKPVYSYTKFWQMIGRGTRLLEIEKIKPWCTQKDEFLILDCWDNFEYFKINPRGKELKPQIPLPDVAPDGQDGEQALGPPLFGNEGDARLDGLVRGSGEGPVLERDLPLVLVHPVDGPGKLRFPRSHQAVEPHDLPLVHVEGERQASTIASRRDAPGCMRSRCLCAFSIITMAASTMAPMAMAMPPRLMILEFKPSRYIAMNAISTPIGSIRIATSALRACSRNRTQTRATTALSSSSVRRRVSTAR